MTATAASSLKIYFFCVCLRSDAALNRLSVGMVRGGNSHDVFCLPGTQREASKGVGLGEGRVWRWEEDVGDRLPTGLGCPRELWKRPNTEECLCGEGTGHGQEGVLDSLRRFVFGLVSCSSAEKAQQQTTGRRSRGSGCFCTAVGYVSAFSRHIFTFWFTIVSEDKMRSCCIWGWTKDCQEEFTEENKRGFSVKWWTLFWAKCSILPN